MASIHYTLAYKDMQALVQFEVNKINELNILMCRIAYEGLALFKVTAL